MQLTQEQINYIAWQIQNEKKPIATILSQEFPRADIFIVRGNDQFSDEFYTKAASFSEASATLEMDLAISTPNGTDKDISDKFYLLETDYETLEQNGTYDKLASRVLDEIDRSMVYFRLEEDLIKAKTVEPSFD